MGSMAISSMLFDGKRYSDRTLIQTKVLQSAETVANYAVRKIYQERMTAPTFPNSEAIELPNELKDLADEVRQTIITKDSQGFANSVLNVPNIATTINMPEIRQITVKSQLNGIKRKIVLTIAIFDTKFFPGGEGSGSNSANTVLVNALKANGRLSLNNVSLLDPNPTYQNPFLISNSMLEIKNSPTNRIPGSVYVYNPNPNNTDTLSLNNKTIIDGNLSYNGNTGDFTPKPDTTADGNVLGDGIEKNSNATIINDLSKGQSNPYLPTQTAASIAQMETTVIYANNGTGQAPIRVVNAITNTGANGSTAQAPSLGPSYAQNIQAPVNQIDINGGTYITDSLNLRSSDVMNLYGDTQLYFQNTYSDIAINGNINTSGGQLTILYGGTRNINIDLEKMGSSKFRGQIFAPNANVTINLQGKTFEGSITANSLNLQGRDASSNASGGSFIFAPSPFQITATKPIQRISWVESNTW